MRQDGLFWSSGWGRCRRQLVKFIALTSDTIYHITQEDDRQVVSGHGGVRQLSSASVYEREMGKAVVIGNRAWSAACGRAVSRPCHIILRAHYTINCVFEAGLSCSPIGLGSKRRSDLFTGIIQQDHKLVFQNRNHKIPTSLWLFFLRFPTVKRKRSLSWVYSRVPVGCYQSMYLVDANLFRSINWNYKCIQQ